MGNSKSKKSKKTCYGEDTDMNDSDVECINSFQCLCLKDETCNKCNEIIRKKSNQSEILT